MFNLIYYHHSRFIYLFARAALSNFLSITRFRGLGVLGAMSNLGLNDIVLQGHGEIPPGDADSMSA